MATCPRQKVRTKTDKSGVEMVLRFFSTYEDVEIKTDGEPSIVEIARRVQSRRDKTTTLAQTSFWRTSRDWSSGTCEWNGAGSVAGILPGRARTHESESHPWHTVVPMDVAAFSVDGGASPIRERDTLRTREHEVVDTSQRWYHLERWSWRRLLMPTK